jgi:hypothetical protein
MDFELRRKHHNVSFGEGREENEQAGSPVRVASVLSEIVQRGDVEDSNYVNNEDQSTSV